MRKLSVLAALLLLAACGSGGLGDLGGIFGSPTTSSPPPSRSAELQGTINSIDLNAQRIDLTVYGNYLRDSQTGQSIYYDNRTRVLFQGREYRPADLERGDQVAVRGYNSGGRYVADTITVTRNARAGG
jgi:hypothetical protein